MAHVRGHDDELEPSTLPDPAWLIDGEPELRMRTWATSDDVVHENCVWSSTAGTYRWVFSRHETVTIVDGEVHVTNETGRTTVLRAGDSAYFSAGTTWIWHVPDYVRKHAVLVEPMPSLLVRLRRRLRARD